MPTITFSNAAVEYDGTTILHPVELSLDEQRIGIIGSNGSGKSTLARLINGLISPTSGSVSYDGLRTDKDGKQIRKRVGFVFSDAESQIIMPRVADDVAFSLRGRKLSKDEKHSLVQDMLTRFQLESHSDDSPHTLSGGEKQLLALASVLILEPETIIADEPTTLLDLRNRRRIAREFAALEQQLIVVTHDLDLIADFDRVLVLDNGKVCFDGDAQAAGDFYTARMDVLP
ncbi:energy-coupling factor ABC transporter ATP-binding protein [Corynebacterium lubricantis]|uniref:energy-coupling factor ABC transporter ATP-binding protein n=1 Tax=Corynebacterium lubricantis TaxID=541095 RepID=UPI000364637C|nr:ABC transporter ATP-binding protein [Corynebacterium lubricantis]